MFTIVGIRPGNYEAVNLPVNIKYIIKSKPPAPRIPNIIALIFNASFIFYLTVKLPESSNYCTKGKISQHKKKLTLYIIAHTVLALKESEDF